MRKFVGLTVVLVISLAFACGPDISFGDENPDNQPATVIKSASTEPMPVLHEVEVEGTRYLADENETLLYFMGSPIVTVIFGTDSVKVSAAPYYAPGTTYYGSEFNGFVVNCFAHPRGTPGSQKYTFGPEGGTFTPPDAYSICTAGAYVFDGEGTEFISDKYTLYYQ
jgi:hypothetical protein